MCVACADTAESCAGDLDSDGGGCALSADRGDCNEDTGSNCVHTASTLEFSAAGQCQACGFPNVVDERRTTCTACVAGHEPNAARTACMASRAPPVSQVPLAKRDETVKTEKMDGTVWMDLRDARA